MNFYELILNSTKINLNCQTVNFLTNEILLTAKKKARKAIDNVRVSLNKRHVYGCFLRLFSSF